MNREALSEGSRSIQPILPHLHSSQKGTQVTYLPGVKGWADRKGGPAEHKEWPRRCEDRGAAREGVSGAGRALQNPRTGERARGEGLCLQRSRRGRGGEGRNSNSRERALPGEARGKKGF